MDYIDLKLYCPFCSSPPYRLVIHLGICPKIKSIEYFEDGGIKKIEFKEFINAGFPELNIGEEIASNDSKFEKKITQRRESWGI